MKPLLDARHRGIFFFIQGAERFGLLRRRTMSQSQVLPTVALCHEFLDLGFQLLQALSLALTRLASSQGVAGALHGNDIGRIFDNDGRQRLVATARANTSDRRVTTAGRADRRLPPLMTRARRRNLQILRLCSRRSFNRVNCLLDGRLNGLLHRLDQLRLRLCRLLSLRERVGIREKREPRVWVFQVAVAKAGRNVEVVEIRRTIEDRR